MIHVHWETRARRILTRREVVRTVQAALAHGQRAGLELAVVLVDDARLAELHERVLDDPAPTDVITLDLGAEGGGPAGELWVSHERARRVARRRGGSERRELALYLVHGVLHLCGFDDREPRARRRMRAAERAVLRALGYVERRPRAARTGRARPPAGRSARAREERTP
jgi:probable rRNA maturation factor